MKILLDAGHGKETAGKRSPVWSDGTQLFEYEFNRDIAKRVHQALLAHKVDCELVVTESQDISRRERVKRVNSIAKRVGKENCLLISIHANAGGGTGWEAWTTVGLTESDKYAEIFYKVAERHLKNRFKIRTDTADGDKDKESDFDILFLTICPAILTENLFMDTEKDCRFIMSEAGRETIAILHIEAILDCIKEWNKKK